MSATPLRGARSRNRALERTSKRPRSWSLPVPEGAYAAVPCWWGSDAWFDALMDALSTPQRAELRQKWSVRDSTLLAIANLYRGYADPDTGRGITVSHETIAAKLELSEKTVQRATRLLEALGFAVTLVTGRSLLSAEEKAEAFQTHGGRQTHAANVLALTLPPVDKSLTEDENVHLNSPGLPGLTSYETLSRQKRAGAHSEDAPRPELRQKQQNSARPSSHLPGARPLGLHQYLAALDKHYAGALGRGHHMGQIERLLRRCGVAIDQWSVRDLVARIDTTFPDSHMKLHAADDALRYFGWMLRRAIVPGEMPPQIRLDRRAKKLEQERAEIAEQRRIDVERMAAVDPREVARIKAEMYAEMSRRRQE